MSPEMGSAFVVEVAPAATPTAFVPVHDLNAYSKSSSRDRTTYPVFMRATPHTLVGAREIAFTLSGYLNMTDPGQQVLRDAEEGDTNVIMRILPDGTNGFTQEVMVGSRTHDADPEAFQEVTFELSAADDPVVVGTGPII